MTSLQRALFEVEMDSLCDSFSTTLRVSPLPPKPVVVETVLEEHAVQRDGIFYPNQHNWDDVKEYIYRQGDKDRMMKLERQRYIDEMVERNTPYCVCFPINDDDEIVPSIIDGNNDNSNNDDDDDDDDDDDVDGNNGNNDITTNDDEEVKGGKNVSVDKMDKEVQHDEQTTQNNNNNNDDDNDKDDNTTSSAATSVTGNETEGEEDGDEVDVMADVPDISTSTPSEEMGGMVMFDDDLLFDDLLIDLAKYLATSTVNVVTPTLKFILKAGIVIPVAIVTLLLIKIVKRVFNTIFKSENEFDDDDDDDCSVCSFDLPPLDPPSTAEEMLEILESRQYETKEEFRKAFEFEFATDVYSYEYFEYDIAEAARRREEEEEDMAWELENKPWWKFW